MELESCQQLNVKKGIRIFIASDKKKKKNPQVTSGMGLKKKNTHTIETYEQIKQISFGLNTRI